MARTAGSTAEVTRRRILEAANTLFAERGYAGTSMRDIAEHLGMTSAALYYHFPAKEELLSALVAPVMETLDRFVEQAENEENEESGGSDQETLIRRFITVLEDSGRTLQVIATEPTALRILVDRHDLGRRLARLEHLIAGTDDPTMLLRCRCALGAIRMGVMSGHASRQLSGAAGAAASPRLADAERELLVAIALAVLNTPMPTRVS
ncbi:TetR family transcriptional regulator [Streptomyces sp. HUCO-GS316]|uniref:TetR family transcriptional regulator n=1 Tax=Streptomyces sp. HUCO-GS316 TaxID=2692198 RepID=UPI00136FD546|nr:TetR/AcrR family transcriptional regulator [Streptomyces sp. HUCO-GS316]MXM65357.1 TetR family transcriptional regulator [Streptomyces sp. HUCO-GS316]